MDLWLDDLLVHIPHVVIAVETINALYCPSCRHLLLKTNVVFFKFIVFSILLDEIVCSIFLEVD